MEIGNGGDGKKLTGRVPTSVAAISLIINTNTLAAARYYNSIADGKSNFRCRIGGCGSFVVVNRRGGGVNSQHRLKMR